jgi:pyruvate formate lyase activating enzyme
MDSQSHTKYTGVPNKLILENLVKLSGTGVALRIRLPLLAGINDDERNIRATAEFTAALPGIQGIDILPYHNMATAKYTRLGEPYRGAGRYSPDPETIALAQHIFEQFGHTVRIGG